MSTKINCVMLLLSFFIAPTTLFCMEKKTKNKTNNNIENKIKKKRKPRAYFRKPEEYHVNAFKMLLRKGKLSKPISYGQTPEQYAESKRENSPQSPDNIVYEHNQQLLPLIQSLNNQNIAQESANPTSYNISLNFNMNNQNLTSSINISHFDEFTNMPESSYYQFNNVTNDNRINEDLNNNIKDQNLNNLNK